MLHRVFMLSLKKRRSVKNRRLSLSLLATSHWLLVTAFLLVCPWAHAQVVDIPDPNLRDVIRQTLGIEAPVITKEDMLRLTHLTAGGLGISNLSGLEFATNLRLLYLGWNEIRDISPLAGLTNLRRLGLENNGITDVRPLSGLTSLEHLEIQYNWITDHSPIDGLSLTHFEYDQSCDLPPEPLAPRLKNRGFPSIFAANTEGVKNRPDLDSIPDYWERRIAKGALHDLFFSRPDIMSLRFMEINEQWHLFGAIPQSVDRRRRYLAHNPNMVFLAEVEMRDSGNFNDIPEDHPSYWFRDAKGEVIASIGIDGRQWRLINYAHPDVQDIIVGQALAVARCGLFDGIVFDWWNDFDSSVGDLIPNDVAQRARVNIVRRIREGTRPDFLILGNTNDRIIPLTGPYLNGGIMEGIVPAPGIPREPSIRIVRESLQWLETNLREPRVNALQGGTDRSELPDSPYNLRLMRATTTMSLTHSDGYVQFGIDSTDIHYWYDFWDADLGRPLGEKFQFYEEIEGLYIREFTNGWAVYNQSGEPQIVTLPEEVQSVASGLVNTEHSVRHIDGDIYLRTAPKEPADLNGDGIVNILDLTIIARALGTDDSAADVNGDGFVNVFDLVFVANRL